jgi:hypothetical protein
MKKIAPVYLIVVGCIAIFAFTVNQPNDIKKAQWLIGTWQNETSRGIIYEKWTQVNENELAGKSFFINENDTIVFETIRLIQELDGLFYIPMVKNQNEGLPVRFALQSISDSTMVFENPEHDFPQIITYTKMNADSLVAEISGINNGQERKRMFPMKRSK